MTPDSHADSWHKALPEPDRRTTADDGDVFLYWFGRERDYAALICDASEAVLLLSDRVTPSWAEDVTDWAPEKVAEKIVEFVGRVTA